MMWTWAYLWHEAVHENFANFSKIIFNFNKAFPYPFLSSLLAEYDFERLRTKPNLGDKLNNVMEILGDLIDL